MPRCCCCCSHVCRRLCPLPLVQTMASSTRRGPATRHAVQAVLACGPARDSSTLAPAAAPPCLSRLPCCPASLCAGRRWSGAGWRGPSPRPVRPWLAATATAAAGAAAAAAVGGCCGPSMSLHPPPRPLPRPPACSDCTLAGRPLERPMRNSIGCNLKARPRARGEGLGLGVAGGWLRKPRAAPGRHQMQHARPAPMHCSGRPARPRPGTTAESAAAPRHTHGAPLTQHPAWQRAAARRHGLFFPWPPRSLPPFPV